MVTQYAVSLSQRVLSLLLVNSCAEDGDASQQCLCSLTMFPFSTPALFWSDVRSQENTRETTITSYLGAQGVYSVIISKTAITINGFSQSVIK